MKFLNPKVHAIIDYLYVLLFATAPSLYGFVGPEQALCYVAALAILGLSLFTRYPLGAVRTIPFTIHGYIELGAAVMTVLCPWLFGFSEIDGPRNFFLTSGLMLAAIFMFTNYKATAKREDRMAAEAREKATAR